MRDERDSSPASVHNADDPNNPTDPRYVSRASEIRERERESCVSWNALVEGRFRLVEHSNVDGRRSVHVEENAPELRERFALTSRERKVMKLALLGHSNKLIAYELGLPQSTVSTVLRSITTKLGGRSRLDLVRLLASVGPR